MVLTMRRKFTSHLVPLVFFLPLLLAACSNVDSTESVESQPEQAVTTAPVTAEPSPSETESIEAESEDTGISDLLETGLPTRTPAPTVTPGPLSQGVSQVSEEIGLAGGTFLGMGVDDWITLGISLLFILASYLIGTWLIRKILPGLVRRTATELDDRLLEIAGSEIRWLVVLLAFQFVTPQLTFLSASLKIILEDIYFVLAVGIATRIVWQLLDLTGEHMHLRATEGGREEELAPVLNLLVRLSRIVIVVISFTILLAHFGINVTLIAAALGFGGLALSLAARDTIADIIAGIIILVDRPFRIGDEIEIKGLGTSGDVVNIGLRTTQILTSDNRMVIVPNSTISENELINYTYPEPRYRVQTHVAIAYDTPIETTRRLIHDTVRQIEGILPDKPVDVLYHEMGDSAMIFRVRWWIESYSGRRRITDRVHTALQEALDAAGIEMPYPIQNLNLQFDPQTVKLDK